MSGQATGWVLRHGPRDRAMRAVLVTIADAANRDGSHAYPGIGAMVDGSGYSRSTVFLALRKLEAEGWIEVEEQGGRGPGAATIYRVVMDVERVQSSDPLRVQSSDPFPPRESRESPERVQPDRTNSGATPLSLNGNVNGRKQREASRADDQDATAVSVKSDAHALTRSWWEAQHPRPSMPFVAARKIVATVLERFDPATVEAALARAGPNLTRFRLDEACRGRAQSPRGAAKTDHLRTQMQRAAQGEL